jgi:hypothetical protein
MSPVVLSKTARHPLMMTGRLMTGNVAGVELDAKLRSFFSFFGKSPAALWIVRDTL